MKLIGIDPGMSGAIALLTLEPHKDLTIQQATKVKAKSRGFNMNWQEMCGWANIMLPGSDHAFIEDVHSMPKQGIASAFKFGYCAGGVYLICAMLEIPITMITPQSWKKHFGLIGAPKEQSIAVACEMFPHEQAQFSKGGSKDLRGGRAEAALIALYGSRKLKGGLK